MRMPKLWGDDLGSLVKWAREIISVFERQEFLGEASTLLSSPGMVSLWTGQDLPSGYIRVDGSLVFISEAPLLFAEIGLRFDPTPPANMFRLPPEPVAVPNCIWVTIK